MPDLQAREQLERQLDELCDRYLRTHDKETQKQIIELRKYPDDLNENQIADDKCWLRDRIIAAIRIKQSATFQGV